MAVLRLLGDASGIHYPRFGDYRGRAARSSPTPSGLKPTGLTPPSRPSGPELLPRNWLQQAPALGSGSASTSSAIAQLLVSWDVMAARLALAVV